MWQPLQELQHTSPSPCGGRKRLDLAVLLVMLKTASTAEIARRGRRCMLATRGRDRGGVAVEFIYAMFLIFFLRVPLDSVVELKSPHEGLELTYPATNVLYQSVLHQSMACLCGHMW